MTTGNTMTQTATAAAVTPEAWEVALAKGLDPANLLRFANSSKPGRRKGATMTIVNDVSGGRVTLKFTKPRLKKGEDEAKLPTFVHVMDGCDNVEHFSFAGTLRGGRLDISGQCRNDQWVNKWNRSFAALDDARRAKAILEWTARRANEGRFSGRNGDGSEWKVRALVSACCGRCGRKLTVPKSIDCGLGPKCRGDC
jgi:hypothetical protein